MSPAADPADAARIQDTLAAALREPAMLGSAVATLLPALAAATDEPFGNSSLLPAFCCARRAREDGVALLLGGDGGDELFAGNERYATQRIFELFGRLSPALQTLVATAVKSLANIPLARKANRYVQQARVPLPDRLDSYAFLVRHDPAEVFDPDFLVQINTAEPRELKRVAFATPAGASTLNRMLYLDWHFTLHDKDLVKVITACRLAAGGWRASPSPIRCWTTR